MAPLYRRFFKVVTLLSAPAMLWPAYEMYALTLNGPQMLFFSITHAFPIFAIVVAFSALIFVIWSGLTLLTIIHEYSRNAIGLWRSLALTLVTFQFFHISNLIFYDHWSNISSMRVVICTIGILYVTGVFVLLLVWLVNEAETKQIN